MGANRSDVTVIFIGGAGRSGSTLVDRTLGQVHGVSSLGEVQHMWRRSFGENQLCGCGEPFRSCGFWVSVVEEAFGGFGGIELEKIIELQRSISRVRHVPMLATPGLRTDLFRSRFEEYAEILARFYHAVAEISGSRILIDSSKTPAHGFVLKEIPGVDIRVVNLVRDSRAVAFSWQRRRVRPEVYWEEELMPRYGVIGSSREWFLYNGLMQMLCGQVPVSATVRYEDLAEKPKATLRRLCHKLLVETGDFEFFVDDRTMILDVDHTVSGNPMRFKHGKVTWREDTEWREKMRGYRRLGVTALTLPLLLRFGYVAGGAHPGSVG